MPNHDSPEPDDDGIGKKMREILSEVPVVDRKVCHNLGYHPGPVELDDLIQIIFLVLIDNDAQTLDSFGGRSEIDTYLYTIARRHILHRLQKRNRLVPLEDLPPDTFLSPPDQEEILCSKEREKILRKALRKLTEHDQRLFALWWQGAGAKAIAKKMGIKIESVYREKSALKIRLQKIINDGK